MKISDVIGGGLLLFKEIEETEDGLFLMIAHFRKKIVKTFQNKKNQSDRNSISSLHGKRKV